MKNSEFLTFHNFLHKRIQNSFCTIEATLVLADEICWAFIKKFYVQKLKVF